jgi:hypothetical protein
MLRILSLAKTLATCILISSCGHERSPETGYNGISYNPGDLYSNKEEYIRSEVLEGFEAHVAAGAMIGEISENLKQMSAQMSAVCLDLAGDKSTKKRDAEKIRCAIIDEATKDLYSHFYSSKKIYERDRSRGVLSSDGIAYADLPKNWKTYSIFLVCNPEWIIKLDYDPNALNPFYQQYRAFGKAIGSEHLAVWFWEAPHKESENKKDGSIDKKTVNALRYDVGRAVGYCIKYKLRPSRSPYILLTTSYPNSDDPPENYFTVELGNLSEQGSIEMLSTLADQIVTGNLSQDELDSVRYWSSWKTVIDMVLSSLGSLSDRIKIVFDTKFFKFEIGKPDESEKAQSAPSPK